MKEEHTQGYWYIIPAILAESGSPIKAMLYGVISSLCNREGYCFATNKYLASKLMRKDDSIISGYIKELENEGWIKSIINKTEGNKRRIYLDKLTPPLRKNPMRSTEKTVYPSTEKTEDSNISISNIKKKDVKASEEASPLLLKDFVQWCRKSPQRHIQIIGEYADERQTKFSTKGQWQVFLKRNMRPARQLAPFTDEQITKAMQKMNDAKYLTEWSLETVIKFLEK